MGLNKHVMLTDSISHVGHTFSFDHLKLLGVFQESSAELELRGRRLGGREGGLNSRVS